jgi:hypothetical protein
MNCMALVRPIRERAALALAFAYSRRPIYEKIDAKFHGEWKHLHLALELTEEKVRQAFIEMAAFLRLVDDEQKIGAGLRDMSFGTVTDKKGNKRPLAMRDLTNKVMHARGYEWNFNDPADPKFVCLGSDEEQWIRADISMESLMAFCGQIAG